MMQQQQQQHMYSASDVNVFIIATITLHITQQQSKDI